MKDKKKFAQAYIMLAKLITMAEEDEGVNSLLEQAGLFVEKEKPEKDDDKDGDKEMPDRREIDAILEAMGEDKEKEERSHTSDEIDAILSAFGMDI